MQELLEYMQLLNCICRKKSLTSDIYQCDLNGNFSRIVKLNVEVYRTQETQHKETMLPGQEEAEQTWWQSSFFFLQPRLTVPFPDFFKNPKVRLQ